MNFKFLTVSFLLFIALVLLMQYGYPLFADRELPHWGFHFLFVYLFISTLIGSAVVEGKMKSRPKEFINVFMLVSSARMILAVLIVVILILQTGENAKFLAIFFAFGYLCFLIAEVIFLFKQSKKYNM